MKNNLFNESEMKEYAQDKAFQLTVKKHDFLKTHAEKVEQGDFKSERSSYLYFYDFLREILGYNREEHILFEDKEAIGRGKVEFVLKSDDKKFMVIELYPAIKKYLLQFKEKLTPKNAGQKIGRKPGSYEWYEIQDAVDYYKQFEKDKLIYPNLASSLYVVFDGDQYYTNQKCFIITSNINLKFLASILSSKVLNFVFSLSGTPLQGNYYDLNKKYIEKLPICLPTPEKQLPLIEKADLILKLNKELQKESYGFQNWIIKEYNVKNLSKKLDKYYELSEDEFIDEMRKKKVDTKSRKNREYLEQEFRESLAIINPLLQEIKETDDEIDQMVYELYGLTEEEIQIIEDTLKN
ncbi:MAG: TaqI-like C-terminal specificity domain-containing protein [Methanobacterium sp.]|jgi:hypothetical protein|nr:TaqI-like C-terminal specificity domain-containing protein [Methanobacterium sp.]